MTLSQARATYGLNCRATPTSPSASGSAQIGSNNASVTLTGADVAYSLCAVFANTGNVLALDLLENDTTGSTAWVAGAQQVETNTVVAAGGITTSGNATVTVTATGMTGSPKAISVALTTAAHTTATLIAAAIAAGLNADSDYSAMWIATSDGADVISKRKPTATYTVKGETINLWPTDVADHNIGIADGTCVGITTASTSTATTAGVESDGVRIFDGDGKDFEGNDVPSILSTKILGFLAVSSADSLSGIGVAGASDAFNIYPDCFVFVGGSQTPCETSYNLTAPSAAMLTITVIGATA